MLPFLLAIAVGLAGLALFSLAFFFPGLYRRNDLIWSGIALFYALVLWFCAERLTGAVLLGQVASVALIGWLGSQALLWRWNKLNQDQKAAIADGSTVKERVSQIKSTDWKQTIQSTSSQVGQVLQSTAAAIAPKPSQSPSADSDPASVTVVSTDVEDEAAPAAVPKATPEAATQAPVESPVAAAAESEDQPAPAISPETQRSHDAPKVASSWFGRLRDRLQGRKDHGKKYVRSASTPPPAIVTPGPTSSPVSDSAVLPKEPADGPTAAIPQDSVAAPAVADAPGPESPGPEFPRPEAAAESSSLEISSPSDEPATDEPATDEPALDELAADEPVAAPSAFEDPPSAEAEAPIEVEKTPIIRETEDSSWPPQPEEESWGDEEEDWQKDE